MEGTPEGINNSERFEKFENTKINIPNLAEFVGRPTQEVIEHVNEKYGDKYEIPGEDYLDYILENSDRAPADLETSENYWFLGTSQKPTESGDFSFQGVTWRDDEIRGARWYRDGKGSLDDWEANDHILLIEK